MAGTTSPIGRRGPRQEAAARGLTIVPPFDHPQIIAGQGTMGLEILEQCPDVGTVFVPVGGGGSWPRASRRRSSCRSRRCASSRSSRRARRRCPSRLRPASPITLPIVGEHRRRPDEPAPRRHHLRAHRSVRRRIRHGERRGHCATVAWLFRNARLVVEPSGAATTAAVALGLGDTTAKGPGRRRVVSGGNVATGSVREVRARMTEAGEHCCDRCAQVQSSAQRWRLPLRPASSPRRPAAARRPPAGSRPSAGPVATPSSIRWRPSRIGAGGLCSTPSERARSMNQSMPEQSNAPARPWQSARAKRASNSRSTFCARRRNAPSVTVSRAL